MTIAEATAPEVAPMPAPVEVDEDMLSAALEEIPGGKITYVFDNDFQDRIVAMMLRDTSFMQRTQGLIDPAYFEDISNAVLASVALRYFAKYKKSPGDIKILIMALKDEIDAKLIRKDYVSEVTARLKGTAAENPRHVYVIDISDREFVVNKVAEFARHQAVQNAILESAELLDTKRDFDTIGRKLRAALDVGAIVGDGGYDYGAEIESRTTARKERAAGVLVPTGITTGYADLDKVLYHRGWGRSEMSVLLGGAKAGKTTALISFAVNAMAARLNVLYVTLEVSADIISQRIDANVADQALMELGSHIMDVNLKVREFMKKAGRLKIHEFPSGSMTVSDLRRLYEGYKAKGETFDMVVVDYADLMAPERYTDNAIENSKQVYVHLRGFAQQEKVALLTATQTNRDGYKATVAKAEHVAEDFNKIRIADLVISINRTEEERAVGEARLYFAASRNQAGDFTVRIKQDMDRMKFIVAILGKDG